MRILKLYNIKYRKLIFGKIILINYLILGCTNVPQQRILNFYVFIDISGSYRNYFQEMKNDIDGLDINDLCKNITNTNKIINLYFYFFGNSVIPYKRRCSLIIKTPMRKVERDSCEKKLENFKTNLINYLNGFGKFDTLSNFNPIFTLIYKKQLNNNFAEISKTIVVIYSDFLNAQHRKLMLKNLSFNKTTYFYFIIPPLERFQDSTLLRSYCLNYITEQLREKHINYSLKSLDNFQSIFQKILKFQMINIR